MYNRAVQTTACRPNAAHHPVIIGLMWPAIYLYHACLYIVNFLHMLRKGLTIRPKYSISATIEGNVIDITFVGELEVRTVLACL